ncbi:hypothetical protein [Streptomyces eurythermus]
MSDAFGFPVLATSALTQAIGFLYRRAEVVLDRRAARGNADGERPPEVVPPVVVGDPGNPLDFEPERLTDERAERLDSLMELLGLYAENEHLIDGQDERVRRTLARLRAVLEDIYGRRITFVGEDRPTSGVRVAARAGHVHGKSTGFKGGRVSRLAGVEVEHDVTVVHPGGEATGAVIDDLL